MKISFLIPSVTEHIFLMMMIAFITFSSSLVPMIESICRIVAKSRRRKVKFIRLGFQSRTRKSSKAAVGGVRRFNLFAGPEVFCCNNPSFPVPDITDCLGGDLVRGCNARSSLGSLVPLHLEDRNCIRPCQPAPIVSTDIILCWGCRVWLHNRSSESIGGDSLGARERIDTLTWCAAYAWNAEMIFCPTESSNESFKIDQEWVGKVWWRLAEHPSHVFVVMPECAMFVQSFDFRFDTFIYDTCI